MNHKRWPVRWPDGTEWDVNGRARLMRKDGRFFIIGHGTYRELPTRDAKLAWKIFRTEQLSYVAEDRRRP